MKSSGIVRRIDELGRIVIPKEIRKTLRIKEGDYFEIISKEGDLSLRKYSLLGGIEKFDTADPDVEHIARELLMNDTLEKEHERCGKYDYQKAFKYISRGRSRKIGWSIWAVACMVCIVVGFVFMLDKIPNNEEVVVLTEEQKAANQVVLYLGNGEKVELSDTEKLHFLENGQQIDVANGQVTYGDNVRNESQNVVYNVLSVPQCAEYHVVLADDENIKAVILDLDSLTEEKEISIKVSNMDKDTQGEIVVYDTRGIQIGKTTIREEETLIDMSQLSLGVYIIQVTVNGKSTSWKIAKEY